MRGADMRQHIIETASNLFYNQGYNSTGINEIIAKSGIAKATLYSHFKSKDDICVAYLRHRNTSFMEQIDEYCNRKSKGKNRVIGIFDFLALFYDQPEFNGCWCQNTVSEIPHDKKRIKDEIKSQKTSFLTFINQLIDDNLPDLSKTRSASLSRQLYVLYEGAIAESFLMDDNWPIKEAKKLAKQLVK